MSFAGQTVLLLGAGYLARFLQPLFADADRVVAVRRTPVEDSSTGGTNVAPYALDLFAPAALDVLRAALGDGLVTVVFMLPPSTFGDTSPTEKLAALFDCLSKLTLRRAVLVSSTGVYAQSPGGLFAVDSPLSRASQRTRRLCAIEQAWQTFLPAVSVLRLAGLYGPGRIIGREAVLSGAVVPGDPDAWLNLVRIEDAARAVRAATEVEPVLPAGLISDGIPVRRGVYYATLARLLRVQAPEFDLSKAPLRGGAGRCDPAATWRMLRLRPQYPDVDSSLAELLCEQGAA